MNYRITQLEGTVTILAEKLTVWNVVKDFGNIADFHPMINKSYLLNDVNGCGARRYCQLLPAGVMEEEVIQWEEGSLIEAKVTGGKMLPPCHFMIGKLILLGSGKETQVTFTFSYKMKYGVLGNLLNALFIKPQFKKAPVKYVNGLKNYVEVNASSSR